MNHYSLIIRSFLFLFLLLVVPCATLRGATDGKVKTMLVFGDSYVKNHRCPYQETWHYKVAMRHGMKYVNAGRNGSSIAFDRTRDGFGPNMLTRLKSLTDTADIVLVIAGHNDADKIKDSRDSLRMFRDSLDALCKALIAKYPKLPR